MKRQFFLLTFMVIIFLTGCAPVNDAQVHSDLKTDRADTENMLTQEPVVGERSMCASAVGDLSRLIDTKNEVFIGYDKRGFIVYRPNDCSKICKADVRTGAKEQLLDLSEGYQNMTSVIYSSPWVVWSESADAELVIGQSKGDGWMVYAANIDTKEIVTVDHDNEYFSDERDFTVVPLAFSSQNNLIVYTGYEADALGMSQAVKMFDLNTKTLRTIAKQPVDNQRGYSDPSMSDGQIVFCDVLMKDGELKDSVIYLYDIKRSALTKLENSEQLALPVKAGRYALAVKPWQTADPTVAIYAMDLQNQSDGWIRVIDDSSAMYKDISYSQDFYSLQTYGNYLTWSSTSNNQLYVFNVAENTFYEITRLNNGKHIDFTMTFNSDMLVWSETSANGETNYPYVLLK